MFSKAQKIIENIIQFDPSFRSNPFFAVCTLIMDIPLLFNK